MSTTTFGGDASEYALGPEYHPELRGAMLSFVGEFVVDFEAAAAALGLTMAQARVLTFAASGPITQKAIAQAMGCDPSNITSKVQRLVADGLVERRLDERDGRARQIIATDRGMRMAEELCASRTWIASVLAGLSDSEVSTVRQAFRILGGR